MPGAYRLMRVDDALDPTRTQNPQDSAARSPYSLRRAGCAHAVGAAQYTQESHSDAVAPAPSPQPQAPCSSTWPTPRT